MTLFRFITNKPLVMNIHLLLLLLTSLVTGIACSNTIAQDRLTGKAFATRTVVMARNGMACTSHPLSTQAAIDVLRKGGNAIDAAIAANAMEGVVEPDMNGIGGDLFAIVWDAKTKKLYGLNASGRSPYGLTLAEFQKRGLTHIPADGPLPVSVPGCVDGWFELHKRFGKTPMPDILSHAIRYAREGYPVHDEAAFYWSSMIARMGKYPNVMDVYAPTGAAPKRGEVFQNPALPNTLEKIA